jgi:hypothetical protein
MAITITPVLLNNAIKNSAYSLYVTAIGGTAPYTYTISSGSLPIGITIGASTGLLSGTPTTNGLYSFTITATDSLAATGTLSTSISVNTTLVSKADNYNRLQHFMCCLGNKGHELSKKLRHSTDCCCDINNLNLLVMYWHVLECYDPTATGNCLTQSQIDAIWEDISCKCGLCFAPYGSLYTNATTGCGTRIVNSGEARITPLGDTRVISCNDDNTTFTDGIGYMSITTGSPTFTVR